MNVSLNWKGGLAFEGISPSGFPLRLDADTSAGGDETGARPMEFIAIGLAGCTAMDVISILSKKRQKVTDFQASFHSSRTKNHPRVFTDSVIEYQIYGTDLDEAAVLRAIELSVEQYCPAYEMLKKAFSITFVYKIFDAASKTLLKEGEYIQKQSVT